LKKDKWKRWKKLTRSFGLICPANEQWGQAEATI